MLNSKDKLALEKNLTIIKQLLERVDKINKAFKTGKEMLQTIHQYWLPEYQNQNQSFKDIYGRRIRYDYRKYRKPRNKFLKKEIKEKYKPPYEQLMSIIKKLKLYKSKYEHYLKNGLPSFTIDKDTLDFQYHGFWDYQDPYPFPFFIENLKKHKTEVSDELEKRNLEHIFYADVGRYQNQFDEYVGREVYYFRNFKKTIFESLMRDLVVIVGRFRKNYISTYEFIMLTYDIHLTKTKPDDMKSDLINFFLLLRYDPELPSQAVSQPPYIELPNMVSFEEHVNEYYQLPQY